MIKVKCIKETYTWEDDNEQHKFSKVVEGHVYGFNKIEDTYCIDPEAFQLMILRMLMVLLMV